MTRRHARLLAGRTEIPRVAHISTAGRLDIAGARSGATSIARERRRAGGHSEQGSGRARQSDLSPWLRYREILYRARCSFDGALSIRNHLLEETLAEVEKATYEGADNRSIDPDILKVAADCELDAVSEGFRIPFFHDLSDEIQ